MARKSKSVSTGGARRPAGWYLRLGREQAAARAKRRVAQGMLTPEHATDYINRAALNARLSRLDYLSRTVKDLRKFYRGFDAADGYNLRDIPTWNANRVEQVTRYGEYLHTLQSSPYVTVSPKKYKGKKRAQFKKALQDRTGQRLKRQKKYLWHVSQTARPTQIGFKDGTIEEREIVKGQVKYLTRQTWYFADYNKGRQPASLERMANLVPKMLPDMPKHYYYMLFTIPHGEIGEPTPQGSLVNLLHRYNVEYGHKRGFANVILGFTFHSSFSQAQKSYQQRQRRKMQREFDKSERAKIRARRIAFMKKAGRT